MSSFRATAVIFRCKNTLQTEEVWAVEITGEVTAMAVFSSPSAFKKFEYLIKINLEDDILVSFEHLVVGFLLY